MRKAILVSALVSVVGLTVSSAWAQNKTEQPKKDGVHSQPAPVKKDDKPADANPADMGMPPEMMAAMSPNEHHKALETLAGDWDAKMSFTMAPGMPPSEGTGTMKAMMILGGRQLHQTFKGTFMGMPFEGAGTIGYNNVTKQVESTWADNMGTATMFSVGTMDPSLKSFTVTGSYDDPMQGKVTMRQVTIITDKDHYKIEFFNKGSDGKEFKSGEITATRKGAAKSDAAPAKTAEPAKKETPAPAKK
jgi:hypothetical protein